MATRSTVLHRRNLDATIRDAFVPIEHATIATAADAQRLVALLIDQHRDAALPLDVGQDVIAEVNEAAQLLLASRARMLAAHGLLARTARERGYSPDCPDYVLTGESKPQLAVVS